MEITLQVNGREMTFSEEEHFVDKTSKTEAQTTKCVQTEDTKPTKTQAKGKYFNVVPRSIDWTLFQEKRADKEQERTRQIILEAFDKVDRHPEKYAKPFKVMIPEEKWVYRTVRGLKDLAKKLGDHIANWVEWALSLAQRISNGETWEAVCNELDTEEWYRLVEWKSGLCRLVGGSVNFYTNRPASGISYYDYADDDDLGDAVPLVVCYDEDCPVFDRMAS